MNLFICTLSLFLFKLNCFVETNNSKFFLHKIQTSATAVDTPSLKQLPFPFGASVKVRLLQNNVKYRNLVIQQYKSITAENSMKFKAIHPQPDVYNWEDADYIVNFAKKNGMRVHGHTLLWPTSNPKWITGFKGDSAALEAVLKKHIQTVVRRYKGVVASWDVVNEAVRSNGNLEKNIWLTKLGKGYIARSFQYAHEADPDAILFYNDFGHEFSKVKLKAILRLVKELKQNNVPIHGIGMQMHTRIGRPESDLKRAINAAAATGLMVHLSELDVSVNHDKPKTFKLDSGLIKQQAVKYKQIVKAYIAIPKKQQFGITTWNVGDADSWKNRNDKYHDYPLIFDYNYNPKLALKYILSIHP